MISTDVRQLKLTIWPRLLLNTAIGRIRFIWTQTQTQPSTPKVYITQLTKTWSGLGIEIFSSQIRTWWSKWEAELLKGHWLSQDRVSLRQVRWWPPTHQKIATDLKTLKDTRDLRSVRWFEFLRLRIIKGLIISSIKTKDLTNLRNKT